MARLRVLNVRCTLKSPNTLPTPGTSHGPRGRTGAAASSVAAAEAVRALAAIVCATLGDPKPDPAAAPAADARAIAGSAGPGTGAAKEGGGPAAGGTGAGPGAAALASLEQLARRATSSQAAGPSASGGGVPGGQPAAELPRLQQKGHVGGVDAQGRGTAASVAPSKPPPGFTGRFRVGRDAAWRAASAQRLGPVMAKALPALCAHPSAAVRAALSRGALSSLLYQVCSRVHCKASRSLGIFVKLSPHHIYLCPAYSLLHICSAHCALMRAYEWCHSLDAPTMVAALHQAI